MEKNKNEINDEDKKKASSDILNDIINDYNTNTKENKNTNNILDWKTINGTVLCKAYNNFIPGEKLLSFDLDDTLVTFEKTSKNKKAPKNKKIVDETSYTYAFDINKIKCKLEEYKNKGYIFSIFSNQNGITLGYIKESDFKKKIDKIFTEDLKYPFVFICAKEKDFYRKPCIGMFEIFKTEFNKEKELNLNECIYVGDAAGRKKSKINKKSDFSDSDYKFALNSQMKFYTPEEFFFGQHIDYPKIENKLHEYDKNNNDHIKFDNSANFKEAIILIGSPGSGKSTFTENVLVPKGYVRINQDNLKTKDKVMKFLNQNLTEGKKVVIDCTNPQKSGRRDYINMCQKYSYIIRAFVFDVTKELAMHLNNLRVINKNRKHYSEAVNNIPIHSFFKYYEKPEVSEGFKEIVNVNFVPVFTNKEDEKIFYYLS